MGWSLNRGRVGIALLILIGVAILIGGWAGENRFKRLALQHAPELGKVDLAKLDDEQPLLVEGTVAADSPVVFGNLVAACEELYWSEDGESGWEDENEFPGTVRIEPAAGPAVPVLLDDPCALSAREYVYDPANSGRRFRGVHAGDLLTIIADVATVTPLALEADFVHIGGRGTFAKDLENDRFFNSFLAGLLILVALVVGLWPAKGAMSKRQMRQARKESNERLQAARAETARREQSAKAAAKAKPSKPTGKSGNDAGGKPR